MTQLFIRPGERIGLLGGSFNPAHEGHIHISLEAIKRLGLDKVIWLVSPQNPLKKADGMAPYEQRLAFAKALTCDIAEIEVTDIERQANLSYSCDTIAYLQARYLRAHFVWLMGADNLHSFHRWRRWEDMFHAIPIAVCDRAPFSHSALHSKAALRFKNARLPISALAGAQAPAWNFLFLPRHDQSATSIRKMLGEKAFLIHNDSVQPN